MIPEVKKNNLLIFFIILLWAFPAFSETVIAEWDANTELDLAGYNIYYGTESGNYDQRINVGNNISWFVDNLIVSAIYYFAITAYDFSGNESNFSEQVSLFLPTGIKGIGLNFEECDEIKSYNILGERVEFDRTKLPTGTYLRVCFVNDEAMWVKKEGLLK